MGPESLAGQWLQRGRLTEAFRTEGRAGEVRGRVHRVCHWLWGRFLPLCLIGEANLGKAWVRAAVQGRPWSILLDGWKPGTQAKLMPKLPGSGARAWPGVGAGPDGLT